MKFGKTEKCECNEQKSSEVCDIQCLFSC